MFCRIKNLSIEVKSGKKLAPSLRGWPQSFLMPKYWPPTPKNQIKVWNRRTDSLFRYAVSNPCLKMSPKKVYNPWKATTCQRRYESFTKSTTSISLCTTDLITKAIKTKTTSSRYVQSCECDLTENRYQFAFTKRFAPPRFSIATRSIMWRKGC